MKKLITLALVALLALTLIACGNAAESPSGDTSTDAVETNAPETKPSATDAPVTVAPETLPSVTVVPETQPIAPEVASPYFINESIEGRWNANAITAIPAEVYFKEGKLYVRCFVFNGYSTPASNVSITQMTLRDKNDTVFAEAGFGDQNLIINALSYVEHTFIFSGDTILSSNVDISSLGCSCQFKASH